MLHLVAFVGAEVYDGFFEAGIFLMWQFEALRNVFYGNGCVIHLNVLREGFGIFPKVVGGIDCGKYNYGNRDQHQEPIVR